MGKYRLFLCSQPSSQEEGQSHPALGPDSSTLFVGRKGGTPWAFPTFSKPLGWMGIGQEGQEPSRNTGPLSWSQAEPSHGGWILRGRTGLGTIAALSWQLSAHTHAHAQTHSLTQTQNTSPAATHTHANTHLHSLGHSPVYLLPGRVPQTRGTLPDPLLVPRPLGPSRSPHA